MSRVNRNMLWAEIIVDELARVGLDTAVIAPGSRSTPLALALAEHPRIKTYSMIDERSAAFFALGYGLEAGRPAALLCSSGTATANFYPAVIEAHYANVPLLVLTADRPHELRDSGANQTVDQVRMYGQHVLWSVDVAPPESNPAPALLRSLRTLAARAYALTVSAAAGVVHLNFPLRKPLEPIPSPADDLTDLGAPRDQGQPYTHISRGTLMPREDDIAAIAALVESSPRGVIVAGPRTPQGALPAALAAFAAAAGYPVLADPLSNLRWSEATHSIGAYDNFLLSHPLLDEATLIIHVGALPASKTLEDFFARNSTASVVLISDTGVWTDPYHRLSHFIHADSAEVFRALIGRIDPNRRDDGWLTRWQMLEMRTWAALDQHGGAFFDGGVIGRVAALMPDESRLFVASSLSVRHLEQYGRPDTRRIRVFCNRGASGIDGTVSSAFGVSAASAAPTVLITGDLAFYHDMNGLLAAKRSGLRLIVILLNNDGGGIFRRLPIAEFEPHFTDLFLTPHGLDFAPAAQMYGLDYVTAESYDALDSAFATALKNTGSTLIEVRTDARHDAQARRDIMHRITEELTN